MVAAALAAIPTIASMLSSLFGKKTEGGENVNVLDNIPSWIKNSAEGLSGWAQQYYKNFVPGEGYSGKFTAGATDLENMGLDQLKGLLGSPATGDLFAAGKQQILDTLGGKYADPNQSPFIKSMIGLSKMNLSDLTNEARAKRGARGTYYTSDALNEESKLNERTLNYLNSVVGDFTKNERQNMLGAATTAQNMDQYRNLTAPLTKIGASQTYGSLLRTIEQSDLEAKYNDFVRQRQEQAMPLQVMQGLAGQQPFITNYTAPTTQSNNTLGNIMDLISKLNFSGDGFN